MELTRRGLQHDGKMDNRSRRGADILNMCNCYATDTMTYKEKLRVHPIQNRNRDCYKMRRTTTVAMILIFTLVTLLQIAPGSALAQGQRGASGSVKGVSPATAESGTSATADVTEIVAKPGDKVHFSIQLNYTAVQPVTTITYSLKTEYLPSDWVTHIWYKGQDIRGMTIINKVFPNPLNLEIDIPDTAEPANYSFWFVARGQELVSESVILQLQIDVVSPTRVIELSSNYPSVEVLNNGSAQFSMTLNNTGDKDELLYLTAEAPNNWIVNFKNQGAHIFQIYLLAGHLTTIQVEAIPPFDAYGTYGIKVRAQSADQVVNSTLDLWVLVTNSTERTISTSYPVISVQAGKVIDFPLNLRNLGTSSNTYLLTASSVPPGWTVSFVTKPGDSTSIKAISLDVGGSATLYLEETPPAAVTTGSYTIPVQIESVTGSIYGIDLTTTIVGSYNITIAPSTLLTSVDSGQPTTFTVTVKNTGQTTVSGVTVRTSVPTDWASSLTPVSKDLLQPGESYTFTEVVTTTSDTVSGDYLVTLTAASDQVNSGAVQVRVTVTTPTSLGLYGVGVAVAVIIALVIVFMRLRRR